MSGARQQTVSRPPLDPASFGISVPAAVPSRENMLSAHPFRDDLAVALERVELLSRENARLRAKLASQRFNWIQWILAGIIAFCGIATVYILAVVVEETCL